MYTEQTTLNQCNRKDAKTNKQIQQEVEIAWLSHKIMVGKICTSFFMTIAK